MQVKVGAGVKTNVRGSLVYMHCGRHVKEVWAYWLTHPPTGGSLRFEELGKLEFRSNFEKGKNHSFCKMEETKREKRKHIQVIRDFGRSFSCWKTEPETRESSLQSFVLDVHTKMRWGHDGTHIHTHLHLSGFK